MSNKTQLQTNNTKLASLITTLQGKAAGGSGSGGGAEIPTVNVTIVENTAGDTGAAWAHQHSYVEEGSIKFGIHMPMQGFETVCNTILIVREQSGMFSATNIAVSSTDGTSYKMGSLSYNSAYIFIGTSDTTITITQNYEGGGF